MHENAQKRQQILQELYLVRQANAGKLAKHQELPLAELKEAVTDIEFALSVLIELGQVTRQGYRIGITGQGVIACEQAQQQQ